MVLGNLEDAIPADKKEAARAGFIELARNNEFGDTGLWTRINSLGSPWCLDDVIEIVSAVGDKLDVIMLPMVAGPWDINYLDQLLGPSLKHGTGSRRRSRSTRCWKPPRASRTSKLLQLPARACTA